MIINHNMASLNTYRQLSINNTASSKSLEKLSSGLRINKAGDDAAGLAISEKMRGQIRGLDQASRNAQDGISMLQTAEGALNETHSILQRMKELATQSANDTNVDADRSEIQKEINQLTSEINRIGNTTEFNTQKLLKGGGSALDAAAIKVASHNAITDTVFSGLDGALVVNGIGVSLDNLHAYDETDDDIDVIQTALQADLDASLGANAYVVSNDGSKFTITSQDTGADAKVDFNGSNTAILDALGFQDKGIASGTSAKFTSTLQIGANTSQNFTVEINDMRSVALGIAGTTATGATTVTDATFADSTDTSGNSNALTDKSGASAEYALDVSDHTKASAAITVLDNAIQKVSAERSKLGAYTNRLEHTAANLGTSSENLTAAESRVRDVDMAKEMMNFQKNNILSQAAQAMLAQANQAPQGVLQLLR